MKEIQVNLKLAAAINGTHAKYASRYSVVIWGLIILAAVGISHLLGKPLHWSALRRHVPQGFMLFLFIYAFPVNLLVTRKLFRQTILDKYRLVLVAETKESNV